MRDNGCTQPLLFRFDGRMWVKLDNTAAAVHAASVTDAFEHLLSCFFVLNVQYPQELWLVYGFLERVLGLKASVTKSMRLSEFHQEVMCVQ